MCLRGGSEGICAYVSRRNLEVTLILLDERRCIMVEGLLGLHVHRYSVLSVYRYCCILFLRFHTLADIRTRAFLR